jgi:hypothetical protein
MCRTRFLRFPNGALQAFLDQKKSGVTETKQVATTQTTVTSGEYEDVPLTQMRKTIARRLSERYGFVNVNTSQLLAGQIAKKTEIGKVCLPLISHGESGNNREIYS